MVILLAGATGGLAQTNLTDYVPGTTYWGRSNYVEYIAGDLPLIISAPHGGTNTPSELPNRTNTSTYTITTVTDRNTAELSRAIRTAAFNRFGRYPHVIICNVQRAKVDCNRDIEEGAQSNTNTQTLWREFHAFIGIARRSVSNNYGRGLYLDMHGHSHAIQRCELGYDVSDSAMFQTDLSSYEDGSTLRSMSRRSRVSFTELMRGEISLGGLLEKRGHPCVPSPAYPNQGTNASGGYEPYFNGGYNTVTYGTSLSNGGTIDAVQIECQFTNVRDTTSSRATFASNLIASLDEFFKYHLGMALDTAGVPPAAVNNFTDKTILEDSQTSTSSVRLASSNSLFWGESSDTNVVDSSGFIFGGSGTNRNVTIRPRPDAFGSNVIVMVCQQATNGGIGADWYYLNVNPVNDAPVFGSVTSPAINPGINLALSNPATDVDGDALTYQLVSGPSNAVIGAGTGTILWRPTVAQADQTYSFVTRVTDSGTNALSATNTATVTVNALQAPTVTMGWSDPAPGSNASSQLQVTIAGQTGPDYFVEASTNMTSWQTVASNTSSIMPFLWADTNSDVHPQRFYRIGVGP